MGDWGLEVGVGRLEVGEGEEGTKDVAGTRVVVGVARAQAIRRRMIKRAINRFINPLTIPLP
jgi:hypothetical protein